MSKPWRFTLVGGPYDGHSGAAVGSITWTVAPRELLVWDVARAVICRDAEDAAMAPRSAERYKRVSQVLRARKAEYRYGDLDMPDLHAVDVEEALTVAA